MNRDGTSTVQLLKEDMFHGLNVTINESDYKTIYGDYDGMENPFRHPLYMRVIYSVAYISIMIIAIAGNAMVVAVVYRNQSMHTVTNYFIVNLAVADIMVAVICLPMTLLVNMYKEWHFGWFMCKATPYLQGVSVCASVNTLAAIAVDRYLAICHPLEVRISKRACKITIISIWIAAAIILIPWAVYYKLTVWQPSRGTGIVLCYQDWPHEEYHKNYFLGAIFLCCYSIPLVLIVVCYSLIGLRIWKRRVPGAKNTSLEIVHKSKVNAVKMLAVVVVMFAFSWLPLYALRLKTLYGTPVNKEVETILLNIINPIAQWLGSSNSGMNPIIYLFFSKRYRRGFQETVNCCHGDQKRFRQHILAQSFANSSNKSRFTLVFKHFPSETNSMTTTQL